MQPTMGATEKLERDRGAVTYPLPSGVVVERDIRVRMRDGVHLGVTVYRPGQEGRFPVVMCVTAYGADFGPKDYSTLKVLQAAGAEVGTMHISDVATWEGPDPGFWVPNGYVVVVGNPRGFHGSEGEAGAFSEQDATDYAELIEWAGIQAWSNGAVGLNGVSYLAINQWMVASLTKPAHLKAIVPWEGASDHLRDSMQHGGIPETRFWPAWLTRSIVRGAGEAVLARGPALLREAMARFLPLENIDVPALICASWSDQGLHTRGAIEAFLRISSSQKWLYTHGRPKWETYYSPDALEWQKAFFDHFLKGEDNGFEKRPRVRLEIRRTKEDFEVRSEDSWPLDRTAFTPRYLDLDQGRLVTDVPDHSRSCTYDAEAKEAVHFDLTFEGRTELTGPMVLKLWIAAKDADDLDIFVAIQKIDRDGREVHFTGTSGRRESPVAFGWLRVSQRRLDAERSTAWRPFLSHDRSEKVQPGEIVPVDIEILPSSTLFEAGETLRLAVSSRDIFFEQAIFGHDETVNKGRHELCGGTAFPSHLIIPITCFEATPRGVG